MRPMRVYDPRATAERCLKKSETAVSQSIDLARRKHAEKFVVFSGLRFE